MKTGYVVSDFHLFARRSVAHRHEEALHRAASSADFVVLNGDMFDFRWTTLPCLDSSLAAAVAWMEGLIAERPHCRFHYVLGNHDCWLPWVERLEGLSNGYENLEWHPSHLAMNTALFLHGDLPLDREFAGASARTYLDAEKRRSQALGAAYQAVCRCGFHRSVTMVNRPRRTIRRLYRALVEDDHDLLRGVEDIYFGHTHVSFRDRVFKGIRFHNTGAAILGLRSELMAVRMVV